MPALNATQLQSIEQYRNVLTVLGVCDGFVEWAINAYSTNLASSELNYVIFDIDYDLQNNSEARAIKSAIHEFYNAFEIRVNDSQLNIRLADLIQFVSGTRVISQYMDDELYEGWETGDSPNDRDILAKFFDDSFNTFAEKMGELLLTYSAIDKGYYTFSHSLSDDSKTHMPVDQFFVHLHGPDRIQVDSTIMYQLGTFDVHWKYDEFHIPNTIKWAKTKWSKRTQYPIFISESSLKSVRQYCTDQNVQSPIVEFSIMKSLENNGISYSTDPFIYGFVAATHNNYEIGEFKVKVENDRVIAIEFRPDDPKPVRTGYRNEDLW